MEPYIATIMMFGGTFAPRGWAFCNGQIMSIAQNTALYSLLGTNYGGNGQTTFGLPDLRGRVPVHSGNQQGPGLTNRPMGAMGGTETVTLLASQLPAHTHSVSVPVTSEEGDTRNPNNAVLAKEAAGVTAPYSATATPDGALKAANTNPAGNGQAHDNMPPFTSVNFIIALEGIFPSRN